MKPPLPPGKNFSRKNISLTTGALVEVDCLNPERSLPLVIRPSVKRLDLSSWAAGNADFIEERLLKCGAILFRGFDVKAADEFEGFIKSVSGQPLEYNERSSPRHQVTGNVYTSTDYPANQAIFLHNENSYQHAWPLRLFFYCLIPARQGGETPIADVRRVFQRISPWLRERFERKKVMYVRNFSGEVGLSWRTTFCADSKAEVEEYCLKSGIEFDWNDNDRLRTRQVRPAIARHPRTGEALWFNHATFFHASTLDPAIREGLLASFGEEDLPHNTYYGDGSPIEPEALDELRRAYEEETVTFPWEEKDILMLDNMMVAHGRAPYVGARSVLVGMTNLITSDTRLGKG
jgi:alpha-ketoglutarate-dependent taurine dioxygenase